MATGRLPDPNTAPVTAKGDLYTYSTVPAKLAVGNNGETLVADSSTSTGLRWQGSYEAGKNKVINGDFNLNQRNFTSQTADQAYGFDRWILQSTSGGTYSAQTFTAGTAPVAGYEARNFARIATTGQSGAGVYTVLSQRIESVRTFANQTVTVSFWAKAASGTPSVAVDLQQVFGTGGSPSAAVPTAFGKVAISTSWARYSVTATVPSISGKTIGTTTDGYLELNIWTSSGSTYDARTNTLGIQTATIDFWGVQVEAGSVATAFQTATGTLAGELAACQRYYWRSTPGGTYSSYGMGYATSTTDACIELVTPVTMRVTPTAIDYSGVYLSIHLVAGYAITGLTINSNSSGPKVVTLNATGASGLTQYRPYSLTNNNNTAHYVGLSSEL